MYKAIGFIVLAFSLPLYALDDPTKPLHYAVSQPQAETRYDLQSILIFGASKSAVINGQSVQEQQVISGSDIKVLSIKSNQVLLEQGSKRWALTLRSKTVVRN